MTDRMTLAVIDDDEDVRTAIDRLLRSMGHDVQLFASAEAFDADAATFDCLIVDVRLPGLSGFEFSERIRLRGSPLPIVFITGDNDPFTRESPGATGVSNAPSLAKPFSDEELMAAVARAMSDLR